MENRFIISIVLACFIAAIFIIGGLFTLFYSINLKSFMKKINKNIEEHGYILEIFVHREYYDDWEYATFKKDYTYKRESNKDIQISKLGSDIIKVNDEELDNVKKLNIKFKDGYTLEYSILEPIY